MGGFDARTFPAGQRDAIAERLGTSLGHRGPDGASTWSNDRFCLVHTRLAIVDLSDRVSYPLTDESGRIHLTFNGEIYNHRALRGELEGVGHRFRSDCDAEVVVHGYEQWGDGVFGRLSGMFAAALVDERTSEIVLARDRFGIKPLVHTTGGPFAFASDVTALVAAGFSEAEPDRAAIAEYLCFHYVPPPATGVLGIRHVTPGTVLRVGLDDTPRETRFADLPFSRALERGSPTDDELDGAARRSVARHLMADVPVGLLLSGGVDSRLVAHLAAEAGAKPLAFTLAFPGAGAYDESEQARRTASRLGLEHHVVPFESGFEDALHGVVAAFDAPFADASAIATLAIARSAREHVKVVLSGTGGDDLFAGYYRHRAAALLSLASMVLSRGVARRVATVAPAPGGERGSYVRLMRSYAARIAAASDGDASERYLSLTRASRGGIDPFLPRPAVEIMRDTARRLDFVADHGDLDDLQRFECASYLPYDLLVKEDRATMAVGLESRVPMLDPEMLGLAERYRARERRDLRRGKKPLRRLAARRFSDTGFKRGFAVPLQSRLEGQWRTPALEVLSDPGDLFDARAAAAGFATASISAPDAWALAVLRGWENGLREARSRRDCALGR